MSTIFLTNDMMFSSRVMNAAENLGVDLRVMMSVEKAMDEIASETRLVILDLRVSTLEPAEVVPEIREKAGAARVIAFGPHIHEKRLATAVDAECDEVLTQGQFNSRIMEVLEFDA